MADVLRAVRGPLEELLGVEHVGPGRRRVRGRTTSRRLVWGEVGSRLIDVLEHATLADFVARAEASGVRRAVAPPTMYFI